MAVALTVSESINGAAVSDALQGGSTGVDFGSCVNAQFAPLVDKTNNQGHQDFFLFHDATIDPITDVKTFIEVFSGTYGGAQSAATDYATVKSLGQASGSSKNNADGLSGGIWIDMDYTQAGAGADASRFDQAARSTNVKIYGDSGTDGIDLASAFVMQSEASTYDSGGGVEATPSAPVDGQIGKSGDTVLGDNAHFLGRVFLPATHPDGGYIQLDMTVAYSFTA